jgi:hypothetical protein
MTLALMCGCYTRNPAKVNFIHVDGGKYATYFARWVSPRGQTAAAPTPSACASRREGFGRTARTDQLGADRMLTELTPRPAESGHDNVLEE